MLVQGLVYFVTCSTTRSPSSRCVPGVTALQSIPSVVTFSPSAPGVTVWPSATSARMASTGKRHTARSGPPWYLNRCASPSSPSCVTRASAHARLGTPPGDTLSCTMVPLSIARLYARPSGLLAPDHPLDGRLEHDLVALVQHAVLVGDDAAVGLLRLALVGHLDLDADGVAF